MPRPSKRTSAPPADAQLVPPTTTPSMFASGAWGPPYPQQSMAPPSTPYWIPGLQQPGMAGSSAQGPWWAPPSSADMEDSELQAWGGDSIPPGGMLNFFD
ncbi:hypothetical protein PVAP13_8NG127501 [Panicum virgatum]|uniref:Uncharacterized protein n=1 Tax=Panicum virgatum TaxID=38727 RepID=A0A8T0PBC2_PANVG|nr:hypothetical protein PVAP13_8NG127501 [Panicum virgatum]